MLKLLFFPLWFPFWVLCGLFKDSQSNGGAYDGAILEDIENDADLFGEL